MSRLRLSWDWLTDYRVRLRFRCGSTDFAEPSVIDIRVYITLDGSFWRRGVPEKRRGRLGTDAISHSRATVSRSATSAIPALRLDQRQWRLWRISTQSACRPAKPSASSRLKPGIRSPALFMAAIRGLPLFEAELIREVRPLPQD